MFTSLQNYQIKYAYPKLYFPRLLSTHKTDYDILKKQPYPYISRPTF